MFILVSIKISLSSVAIPDNL
jgi:hypothetical protein